ncbi:MAG: VCBS repeat-containing protein [Bacteroidetes bacterium]|nr:VCBS repeat-containing protein [Bacteroidota bacterium]
MFIAVIMSCNRKHNLFEKISSSHSGIVFNNTIIENDSINPLSVVNIYSGGGVGIGDFNNDGLQDIFLTGGMVPCKLYLNKGNFKFEDITSKAGVEGMGRWARGVSVVDINNDGLMDIYICNTLYKDTLRRRNILYINLGTDKDGIPHFKDEAAEYGLDMHVQSTMASFFDYDNDGDLDMYLTVNEATGGYAPSVFVGQDQPTSGTNRGRLYRNDMDLRLGHPVFHDVSDEAGIRFEGYGHAASICDINNDGWKDIYVSDDFISNNILYINNHDGTFTNRVKEYFKHTSYNSMGQDVVDINNDGLPDVVELDMSAEDNYRKKMMSDANNTNTYQNFENYGYQYQYVRNTLQLNQGPTARQNDSIGIPAFSEIGFMSGMSQTDWSWDPLVIDFDNDSYRDLVITNGFPRDWSDHDFMAYRQQANGLASNMQMLNMMPQVKLHNYAFKNNGEAGFEDVTNRWGLSVPTFSNGAAYADFDNDGAMDMVINNINDEALLYRNTSRDDDTVSTHYLNIQFKGGEQNVNGIGAIASIYYGHGRQQVYDNNPYRGYLSSVQCMAHFGLGKTGKIDSAVIKWNNGKKQTIKNIKAGQTIVVRIADAKEDNLYQQPVIAEHALFKEVTADAGIKYVHKDDPVIDFNIQALLPHKLSEYNPALAVADINSDGLDDFVVGGNANDPAKIFLQEQNGKFVQKELLPGMPGQINYAKDEGILLFDANGDGKPDLYITRGGYSTASDSIGYQDKLYINDGKGNFTENPSALPFNHTSKLCVRAFDFNNDGKLDLFVSGRVALAQYPRPVSSFIFRNDSENGQVKFTDVTAEVAPDLKNIGMVCDALFTDFDNDGKTDLIVVGEWMPVTFLKNIGGRFENVTPSSGMAGKTGWWNSIVAGDFRHTGRTDYIVGNIGLNTFYRGNEQFPVCITAKDFDHSGTFISIPSLYLADVDGQKKEFPAFGRDDIARQFPGIKKRFATYKPFALAAMDDILTPEQRNGAIRMQANMLQSCYLRNDGAGKFTMVPLPREAQVSMINAMVVDDFDGDGNLDVLMNGNDYGTEVGTGRYDALNGLLLKGDGKGNFAPQSILQSGIYIPGNGKALVKLLRSSGDYLIAASQHQDVLKLYQLKRKIKSIRVEPDDVSAMIKYKNGESRKEEFYYGNSFLSQSSRFIAVDDNVEAVTIKNSKGKLRSF